MRFSLSEITFTAGMNWTPLLVFYNPSIQILYQTSEVKVISLNWKRAKSDSKMLSHWASNEEEHNVLVSLHVYNDFPGKEFRKLGTA